MLHLIEFDNLHDDTARACLSQYQDGDVCVFVDNGGLIAAAFPRRGAAFLLDGEAPRPAQAAALEVIDHDRFIALVAEHGPVTSWYP